MVQTFLGLSTRALPFIYKTQIPFNPFKSHTINDLSSLQLTEKSISRYRYHKIPILSPVLSNAKSQTVEVCPVNENVEYQSSSSSCHTFNVSS
jgi:hypothetical protein